ncbi:S46 family peptidase [Oleiharenicola sp. Vm1]|uniref:S46 family peptidase n=1 Tax=Oleiharenicola sp. Vm1 TaxID=3398393 RepID=UPI0039F4CC38
MQLRFPRLIVTSLLLATAARADDGMWLLNAPPLAELKQRYGFEPTPAWLEHVQKSAVRFNNGGSGSFASADGLIITNHHVGIDSLHKLSTKERDLLKQGYLARSRAEELKCVDLELNVLMSIEDVTARVNAGVKPGMSPAEALAARNAAKAAIEKESLAATGLRSDIVTLFQGARYHLYRYKRYTDVRLVFAPEEQAAFFGGDPDNFEYPRYNLDVTIFRAYENGQPAKVEHFLKWNPAGTKEGDLVFLAGHPGSTQRLITLAELEYARDVQLANSLRWLKSREVLLNSYSKSAPENARRAQDELRTIENSRKVWDGRIAGLLDPQLIAAKKAEEDALRKFAADQPALGAADAWDKIAAAQQVIARTATRYAFLETYNANSDLFKIARDLLRATAERPKADGDRLSDYRDARKAPFEFALFSAKPIYEDLEELKLAHFLTLMAMELGANDPAVVAALDGQSPTQRAAALVAGTKLKDIAVRRALYAQDAAAVAASADPMIQFARAIDGFARDARKTIEQQTEVKEQAHARIAQVRFAKDGDTTSPDATFTLRLSYGAVKGIATPAGKIPAYTQIGGTYTRAAERGFTPPFDLPASWVAAKDRLALDTPFNFISTNYSIGGNSGSPTINRDGEFVGIIFDGNIHTLVWNYAYSETQARSVSVDVRGILEAMRKIYGADAVVAELLGQK